MTFHELSPLVEMTAAIGVLFLPVPIINALAGGYLMADAVTNHRISRELVRRAGERLSLRNFRVN